MIKFEVKNDKFVVSAKVIETGKDLVVVIGGGESHIGAVGVSFPTASIINDKLTVTTSIITLPSHKDDVVAKITGEKISKALERKVVVIAGIHFDNISKNDIDEILNCCELLTEKIIRYFSDMREK